MHALASERKERGDKNGGQGFAFSRRQFDHPTGGHRDAGKNLRVVNPKAERSICRLDYRRKSYGKEGLGAFAAFGAFRQICSQRQKFRIRLLFERDHPNGAKCGLVSLQVPLDVPIQRGHTSHFPPGSPAGDHFILHYTPIPTTCFFLLFRFCHRFSGRFLWYNRDRIIGYSVRFFSPK